MAYLLDTDIVIDHLAEDPWAMALLDELAAGGLFVSAVTFMEVLDGVLEAASADALGKFEILSQAVGLLAVNEAVAREAAPIRVHLRSQHRRIRDRYLDIIIAATALVNDLTVVTRNVRDYSDIPRITLYESS